MDKIWYRNFSKSEANGRCGGDEKPRMTTQNRQKSNAKKTKNKNCSCNWYMTSYVKSTLKKRLLLSFSMCMYQVNTSHAAVFVCEQILDIRCQTTGRIVADLY